MKPEGFIAAIKSANIKYHNTKFGRPGDFAAGICTPLLYSCFSSALNRRVWTSYMKTYTNHPTRITNDSVPWRLDCIALTFWHLRSSGYYTAPTKCISVLFISIRKASIYRWTAFVWLVSMDQMDWVYCAVRNNYSNVTQINIPLERPKSLLY
jgi:hypothetical protein